MSEMAQMMVGGIPRNDLPAMPTVGAGSSQREDSPAPTPIVDSPYLPPTFAVPTPYLRRFMFGFRLKAKSEHEATDVFGWYGVGVELVRCRRYS